MRFSLVVFWVCVTFKVCLCSISVEKNLNQNNEEENLVAAFVEYLSIVHKKSSSVFIVVHDYQRDIPQPFQQVLQNFSKNFKTLAMAKAEDFNITDGKHWFSWLDDPAATTFPDASIFYILLFHTNTFETVIVRAAKFIKMLTDRHYFILWNQDGDYESVLFHERIEVFRNKILLIRSNVTSHVLSMTSLCFFCDAGSPQVVSLGQYGVNSDFLETIQFFPDFTKDLHEKFLLLTWIKSVRPEDALYMRENYKRLFPTENIIHDFGKYLNFHWMIRVFEYPPSGTPLEVEMPDGTWYGMSGDVYHKYADFAISKVNADNMLEVADYSTHLTVMDTFSFLSRVPKPAYSWSAVLQPYTVQMWLLTVLACFLSSIVFSIILHINLNLFNSTFPANKRPKNLLLYSLRYLFSTLMEENPPLVPVTANTRVFLGFWWLYSIVIICGYESKLISFFAHPELEVVPTTFEDLANRPKWGCGMSDRHIQYYGVLSGGEYAPPRFLKISPRLESSGTLVNCVARVTKEDFSCMTITTFLNMFQNYFVDKDGHKAFNVHTSDSPSSLLASVLEKHTILKRNIDRILSRLWASGIFQKYKLDYNYAGMTDGLKMAKKENRVYTLSRKLNLGQMSGLFYGVILFCWVAPFLSFIWEICQFKRENMEK